jgi:hypothetical protein
LGVEAVVDFLHRQSNHNTCRPVLRVRPG